MSINLFSQEIILTKKQIEEEVVYLKDNLEKIHPNLYHKISKKEFEQKLDHLIKDSVSLLDYSKGLAATINLIGDGHTWTDIGRGNLVEYYKNSGRFFSLKVKLKEGNIICCNDEGIPDGATLISINGISIDKIKNDLLAYIPGEKRYYKISKMELELPFYLYLLYKMESFEVLYKYKQNNVVKKLKGRTQPTWYATEKKLEGNFEVINDYGYLTLDLFGDTKKYFDLIDQAIRESEEHLIIDLRNNPGGNTILGNYMLSGLSKIKYQSYDRTETKFSKPTRKFYHRYIFSKPHLAIFLAFMPEFWRKKGVRVNTEKFNNHFNQFDYKGDVTVVVSNYTFSSADDFARIFKKYDMGKIIGQETGGQKNSYGDIVFFKLPYSKIKCACSHKLFCGLDLDDKPTDGVKPDYDCDIDMTKSQIIEFIEKHKKNSKWIVEE